MSVEMVLDEPGPALTALFKLSGSVKSNQFKLTCLVHIEIISGTIAFYTATQ
jgi:hypothetical protein